MLNTPEHVQMNLELIYYRYGYFACIPNMVTRIRNKENVTSLTDMT